MRNPLVVDKAALFERLGYEPHSDTQRQYHDSNARFRIPICGRRWGKSKATGTDLTAYMFTPDSRYWICGPTYKLGEKEFRVVHDNFVKILRLPSKDMSIQYNVNQGHMRLHIKPWNAICEVVSAEKPDSLLGEGLDGVVMSEAARHKRRTWEQYIEPALTDKRGWADFPTTPQGYNYIHGLYELGQQDAFKDVYESWKFPSWSNPILYPEGRHDPEIVRIESLVSPEYFWQEYGAEFTSFVGQIYSEFDRSIHVKPIQYNPAWANYWVFDFGWSNPFVCLDIMVDPSDNVYVWREYQVQYVATYEHGRILRERENPEGFHVDGMYADPRGADEIATLTAQLGYITARPVPWKQGVEAVKRWLKIQPDGQPKLFFDPSCVHTIRQVEQLRKPNEQEGKNPKEGQHDYDDHGADALRYFFSEWEVLGARYGLSDVYAPELVGSESHDFFTYHSPFRLDSGVRVGYE